MWNWVNKAASFFNGVAFFCALTSNATSSYREVAAKKIS